MFLLYDRSVRERELLGVVQFGDVGMDGEKKQGESHLCYEINASN